MTTAIPMQAMGYSSGYGNECCQPCWGVEVYGDYLYWKVTEDQLQYAAIIDVTATGIGSATSVLSTPAAPALAALPATFSAAANVNTIEPNFDYNSGFRVGLGYNFGCCSNWSVNAEYTRLHFTRNSGVAGVFTGTDSVITGSTASVAYPVNMPIISVLAGLTSGGDSIFPTFIENEFRFRYDTVDLQLGVTKYNGCFSARPYIGGKGAWIRQNSDTNYLGLFAVSDGVDEPIIASLNRKNDFKGGGLEIGIDSALKLWGNIALTGGFQAALLYGRFNVESVPSVIITGTPTLDVADVSVTINRLNHNDRIRPMVDTYVGLGWDTCFCNRYIFEVGAAWELQYWWNQWQASGSIEEYILDFGNAPQGDLMLQGLTVFASITF